MCEVEHRSERSGKNSLHDEWNRLQSKLPRLLSFGFSIQNEPNHSTLQAGTQAGKEKTNAQQMLSTILKANVISTFPNVTTALRIYLSLMCTNCSGEQSFSRLALLKNQLRSTMSQDLLNYLAIVSIE